MYDYVFFRDTDIRDFFFVKAIKVVNTKFSRVIFLWAEAGRLYREGT